MNTFTFGNKEYGVDVDEFLSDPEEWDENYARGMAPKVGIISGLSDDHWKIINFIRDMYQKTGKCPLVYETCRMNRLQGIWISREWRSSRNRSHQPLKKKSTRSIFEDSS